MIVAVAYIVVAEGQPALVDDDVGSQAHSDEYSDGGAEYGDDDFYDADLDHPRSEDEGAFPPSKGCMHARMHAHTHARTHACAHMFTV